MWLELGNYSKLFLVMLCLLALGVWFVAPKVYIDVGIICIEAILAGGSLIILYDRIVHPIR